MDESEVCEYRDAHPEIEARLESLGSTVVRLESEVTKLRDARMADFQQMIDKLSAVHEKVNAVAQATQGLNGKMAIYGIITTGAGAVLMFVVTSLFAHLNK